MVDETSPVFGEDPLTEEPLFQTPPMVLSPPLDVSPEYLYSDPLTWMPPGDGTQFRMPDMETEPLSPAPELEQLEPQQTELQQTELQQIKPPQPEPQPDLVIPFRSRRTPSSSSSPESKDNGRKRKSEDDEDDDYRSDMDADGPQQPVKKTAHNMIEKRYRTNLNDKIAALRDTVPSLRAMTKNSRGEEVLQEDLHGLTPAHKLNKATVLSKATEYIAHLERRNKTLWRENCALKQRIDNFEILLISRQAPNGKQSQGQRVHNPKLN